MNRYRVTSIVVLLLLMPVLGCEDDSTFESAPRFSQNSDSTFTVGDSSVLDVDNFAGAVDVRPGSAGTVSVEVTRWAGREEDLDEIEVVFAQLQDRVRVTTRNPAALHNVSVDLAITVPPDVRASLRNAAGTITYEGRPQGLSRFLLAAGTLTLRLPADVNVQVHLSVAAGSIDLAFPVVGQVSDNLVEGTIGTGADGRIEAQVAAGRIVVARQ